MTRIRLIVVGIITAMALVLPAGAAMAKPDLCDFVQNTECDRLP